MEKEIDMSKLSPMMVRYFETKKQYEDCILFYRLGDFYEMFFDDALTASRELEITLTGKQCGLEEKAPMCGVPHHSVSSYVAKLVEKGYKVAICEQLEDPKAAKGLVERDVVRIITPGTITEENILDEKKNNYLGVIYKGKKTGIAFSDISTGEVYTTEVTDTDDVMSELARYNPTEIVINKLAEKEYKPKIKLRFTSVIDEMEEDYFEDETNKVISGQFKNAPALSEYCEKAVLGMVRYLRETQKRSVDYIDSITVYRISEYVEIDPATRRNLEITETMRDKAKKGSLLGVIDKTQTSMGARLLKQWTEKPLINPVDINKRLYAVNELFSDIMLRGDLRDVLAGIYDIARITSRVSLGSASARDLLSLKASLTKLPELKYLLSKSKSDVLSDLFSKLDIMEDIRTLIDNAISDNQEECVIKGGYSQELDELKYIKSSGAEWILDAEQSERERTGIKTLRIRYNKVFGYYIEVSNSFKNSVPENYIRKQTLVNGERYITPELKEMENKVLGAASKIEVLETQILSAVRDTISGEIPRLKEVCRCVSVCDALCSLAEVAYKYNYTMPEISDSGEIIIKDGRHPVVERFLKNTMFVPNDTALNENADRLMIITGPNMAGKSTYMRQVAVIVLMAQMGSFVPASYAKITPVDKIFTRVGASDDIAAGQSTFMLEMVEVSAIIKNATKKSLVIMDEIGRGTSTYDGLSIAWSVAEHMCDKKKCGAKTLFATHYHEMTELEDKLDGIKNYNIAVKKRGDDITFLRKIVRGGTDDSYGIEVAALAGVPNDVIKRAKEILKKIESDDFKSEQPKKHAEETNQLGFGEKIAFDIAEDLKNTDVTTFTPIEAMNKLYELSKKARDIID